jgi:hypothetical protein
MGREDNPTLHVREYVWAIFPKSILWPVFRVYEGFRALGA